MKKINTYHSQTRRALSGILSRGRLFFLPVVISLICSSCKVRQYHFIGGQWQHEEKKYTLVNKEKGATFVYNLDEMNYTLPENILLTSETAFSDTETFRPDKFCRSILKKVNYNQDTDSLYFILQGHLIVFSSPEFHLHTATGFIDLTRTVKGEYPNPSIDWYDEEGIMDHYIYRTIYCSKKEKQYLVKDVFRWRREYIHMVYIYQSRTRKNKHISPRIWRTTYDVTDPVNVIHVGKMLTKYNRISIMNTLQNR